MNAVVHGELAERAEWQARRKHLDAFRPQAFFIEPERSKAGLVVSIATILLTNRECPWRCVYCDLWKHTTVESVPRGAIPAQIDFALRQLGMNQIPAADAHSAQAQDGTHFARARQIKLYNAGSFFDPKAIPPEDWPAIAERVRSFERVIVECHPALVGAAAHFRDRIQPCRLEVAMGLEIADDRILEKLNKRMTLESFRRAADFLHRNEIDLRAFIIVNPPHVVGEIEGRKFAERSIDFAFDCGATAVSVIPGRTGPVGLRELAERGEFCPPTLATLEAVLEYGVTLGRGRVFADLWDVARLKACPQCAGARISRLSEINLAQSVLPPIQCDACAKG